MQKLFLIVGLIVIRIFPLPAEIFSYKQAIGDKWRIISTVEEDVLVNGKLSHRSEIVERVASEVAGMANPEEALIKAVFQSAEKAVNEDGSARFAWGEDYEASFMRTSQGRIQIQSSYFRPSTRNVPTFPAADVGKGRRGKRRAQRFMIYANRWGWPRPTAFRLPPTTRIWAAVNGGASGTRRSRFRGTLITRRQ